MAIISWQLALKPFLSSDVCQILLHPSHRVNQHISKRPGIIPSVRTDVPCLDVRKTWGTARVPLGGNWGSGAWRPPGPWTPLLGGVIVSASCKICRSSGNRGVGVPWCSTVRSTATPVASRSKTPIRSWTTGGRPPLFHFGRTPWRGSVLSSHSSHCVSDTSRISAPAGSDSSVFFLCRSNLTSSSSEDSCSPTPHIRPLASLHPLAGS